MNTLAHLTAILALLWLSIYCFETLNERALGVAVLLVMLLFIPLMLFATRDDWVIVFGQKKTDDDDEDED